MKVSVNVDNHPQVPRTKQRRVLTATPPPHNREQLLQFDQSVHKYCGSLGGLAGRAGGSAAGLGSCLVVGRDTCLVPGRLPLLAGSRIRPSDPLDSSLVTSTALPPPANEFTTTYLNFLVITARRYA